MALAMAYVSEVMRQFPTTVIVHHEDWPEMMRLFKFDPTLPSCVLDRMTFRPAVGGFQGIQQRMGEGMAECDQLKAKVAELEQQLEVATAPSAKVAAKA